jgi:hypothetical protein
MSQCPQCNTTLRIAGVKEYIDLNPNDTTKGVLKREFKKICVNPECTLYAGSTKTVSFEYQKGDKKVIEHDNRPNIDYSNPAKIACIDITETVLEVKQNKVKAFAEKVVNDYSPEDAMILASKLSEKFIE